MDPIRLRNWALALVACAAVASPSFLYLRSLVAQEASAVAKQEVQAEVLPMKAQLQQIVEGQHRDEDWKKSTYCLDREYQHLPADQRAARCKAESEHRWATWEYEDCVARGDTGCAAPPPIPWRQP